MGEDEDYDEIIKECKAKKRDYEMDMDVIPVSFAIEHKSMQGNLKMLMERDGGNLLQKTMKLYRELNCQIVSLSSWH